MEKEDASEISDSNARLNAKIEPNLDSVHTITLNISQAERNNLSLVLYGFHGERQQYSITRPWPRPRNT